MFKNDKYAEKVQEELLNVHGFVSWSPSHKEAKHVIGYALKFTPNLLQSFAPKAVIIRYEIALKPGSKEVSWRFVTNAEVKINGNTATLSQNGKMFYIRCLLSGGAD